MLLDQAQRPSWDRQCKSSKVVHQHDEYNDVIYTEHFGRGVVSNRDFVLGRSLKWLGEDEGSESAAKTGYKSGRLGRRRFALVCKSVPEPTCPPKKKVVRAVAYLSGWVCEQIGGDVAEQAGSVSKKGCRIFFQAVSDAKGSLGKVAVGKHAGLASISWIGQLYAALIGIASSADSDDES
jgi:hypothetical protein